jgi:hypothetical protein
MARSSRSPQTRTNLPDSIHHQLNMYALAAGAAGVGVLALAHPAEAKIVYTPAHVVLGARSNTPYYIDLNHDGVKDFVFLHDYFYSSTTGFWGSFVQVTPYKFNGNRILGHGDALALRAGAKIGPSGRFSHYGTLASGRGTGRSHSTKFYGFWANGGKGLRDRYVGLKFAINGEAHYGWARVSVSKFRFSAVLTGYAYETIADTPIKAGATSGTDDGEPTASIGTHATELPTLGMLALGERGLSMWRREDEVAG